MPETRTLESASQPEEAGLEEIESREEPVLQQNDFSEANDLDDLETIYRQKGFEFESVRKLFQAAEEDIWKLRNREIPLLSDTYSLPCDQYNLHMSRENQVLDVDLNVAGIPHGQRGFLKMGDETRDYLREEIERMADRGQVYLEDGFDDVLFNNHFEDSEQVIELDDRKLLDDQGMLFGKGARLGVKFLMKPFLNHVLGPIAESAVKQAERQDREGRTITPVRSAYRGLNDPREIPRTQAYIKDMQLPLRFRQDYWDKRLGEVREQETVLNEKIQASRNYNPRGVTGHVADWYRNQILKLKKKRLMFKKASRGFRPIVSWERSKYMHNKALRKSWDAGEDEIWVIAGAQHQADLKQLLEEADPEERNRPPVSMVELLEESYTSTPYETLSRPTPDPAWQRGTPLHYQEA